MPEEIPTVSAGAPKCPHCKAPQMMPLTTVRTIKVHPCQSCSKTFAVVETIMQYGTIQTIFPPDETPVPE